MGTILEETDFSEKVPKNGLKTAVLVVEAISFRSHWLSTEEREVRYEEGKNHTYEKLQKDHQ